MIKLKSILRFAGVGMLLVVGLGVLLWNPAAEREREDGRTVVRYWYVVGARDDVPYHARRFNEVQDSIFVEATPIPWQEHEKKILTAVLSGDPPDVVSQFVPVVKWASRMALTPLDRFIEEDRFDSTIFFDALWDEMKWEGSVFALPVNSASYALFYNRTLFREAGLDPDRPPQSWDELLEVAERLTLRDSRGRLVQMGFVPDYGNLHTSQLMAWQRGVRFLTDDGTRVNLADPTVVDALQWMADFYRAYDLDQVKSFTAGFGPGEQHGFLSGKLGMAVLDMSFLDQIERYRPDLDFGVAMIPSFEDTPTASSAGSWWLAILRGARNPDAAWAFMKFAVEKETQINEVLSTQEDLFPANRLAAEDPRFMRNAMLEVFVRQMDYAHSPAVVPMAHDVFWREFYGAQERVVSGRQSPESALRQAERVVQSSLDRSLGYDRFVRRRISLEEVDR